MRKSRIERKTLETDILVDIDLDGSGKSTIDTGIGFLDHMLTLMAFHGSFDMEVKCTGDLYVDDHHTVEDIGIALGEAFNKALGDKRGIRRYASIYIPMDESLSHVVLDISNRPYLVFNADFKNEKIGTMASENFKEFFRAFIGKAGITLHINVLYGENDHHKIEGIFKAFARALNEGMEVISDKYLHQRGFYSWIL